MKTLPSTAVRHPNRGDLCRLALAVFSATLALGGCTAPRASTVASGEPIIHDFVADPSAHVFDGRVYLYLTNDAGNSGEYWDSTNWRSFSSDDLVIWRDEGVPFSVEELAWAEKLAWAPGAVESNGSYYLYLPVERTKMAVVRGPTPTGPFQDPIGEPLIDNARDANAGDEPIDPMVYVDDDGTAYLYFGTRVPKVVILGDDRISLNGPIEDLELDTANYGEAPWVHRHEGIYYFTYSTGWPGQIAYATGPGPLGPFTYRGILLDYTNISTNHHAIIPFRGNWYLFYHNASLPGGGDHKRSVHLDLLHHETDGSIRMITPQ